MKFLLSLLFLMAVTSNTACQTRVQASSSVADDRGSAVASNPKVLAVINVFSLSINGDPSILVLAMESIVDGSVAPRLVQYIQSTPGTQTFEYKDLHSESVGGGRRFVSAPANGPRMILSIPSDSGATLSLPDSNLTFTLTPVVVNDFLQSESVVKEVSYALAGFQKLEQNVSAFKIQANPAYLAQLLKVNGVLKFIELNNSVLVTEVNNVAVSGAGINTYTLADGRRLFVNEEVENLSQLTALDGTTLSIKPATAAQVEVISKKILNATIKLESPLDR